MRPRRISRQKFPKRTRILSIPSKPHFFHSVHSVIGSRMNGMILRSFRKRNSSQKNTNTVYSEYSYSGIVPEECAPCQRTLQLYTCQIFLSQMRVRFSSRHYRDFRKRNSHFRRFPTISRRRPNVSENVRRCSDDLNEVVSSPSNPNAN